MQIKNKFLKIFYNIIKRKKIFNHLKTKYLQIVNKNCE